MTRQRIPGVRGARRGADGTRRVEIEAAHRPVVAFRGSDLTLQPQADVQAQVRSHPEIVLNIESHVSVLTALRRVVVPASTGRQTKQERRHVLAERRSRRVVHRSTGEGGGKVVSAAALAVGEIAVPQQPQIDSSLQDVAVHVLVQRGVDLKHVVRIVDTAAAARAQPGEAVEVDLGEVGMRGGRKQRFGESESREVKPVAVSFSQFAVLQEIETHVQDQRWGESVNVVERGAPVDLIENRAGGVIAGERAASFEQTIVVPEVIEQLMPVADIEIEATKLVVERIELTRSADVIVIRAVHIAGIVRQVDVIQDVPGDRADLGGGNEIPGEGLPGHARALPDSAGGIVDLITRAEPQQRREIAVALGRSRNRGEGGLRDLEIDAFVRQKEEHFILAVEDFGDEHRSTARGAPLIVVGARLLLSGQVREEEIRSQR